MYNFDEIIDRRHTNAMNTDGFRQYIFHADENMVFPYKDEEFIRMWVADMEFATPDVVIDAIRRRLDRRIFGYTRVSDPGYYEAFSAWCRRRYGWDFPKKELVMSNGVIPALFELVEYICKPDEKVLFLTPSYAYFKHAADHSGRAYVCSDLINSDGYYSIDWEDLERRCAEPKTRLFIHCDPHNPSGRVWTPQELQRLAGILEKHDMWVISDEIHCDLLRRGQVHTPLGKVMPGYKKLVTCMAPSKTFNLAGLLVSDIIIPDDGIRAAFEAKMQPYYLWPGTFGTVAQIAAYTRGAPWLDALLEFLAGNARHIEEFVAARMPRVRFRAPEATYLGWLDFRACGMGPEELWNFMLREARVATDNGPMFGPNGEGDGFQRLNFACPRQQLDAALERIASALERRGLAK